LEGRLDAATLNRPYGRISRSLPFRATGKGEAQAASLEGTEAGATGSTFQTYGAGMKDRPRSTQRTSAIRTHMYGVVWEGEAARPTPITIARTMESIEVEIAGKARLWVESPGSALAMPR